VSTRKKTPSGTLTGSSRGGEIAHQPAAEATPQALRRGRPEDRELPLQQRDGVVEALAEDLPVAFHHRLAAVQGDGRQRLAADEGVPPQPFAAFDGFQQEPRAVLIEAPVGGHRGHGVGEVVAPDRDEVVVRRQPPDLVERGLDQAGAPWRSPSMRRRASSSSGTAWA
jgi:hypothetical protein